MKEQHRVVWSEGMFLTPQHFQTQDEYFERLIDHRFTASHFANWGFTEFSLDTDALANGVVRMNSAKGVMPDGEPFDMPEADECPASRTLKENFPATKATLDVYLAIPELRRKSRNVTIPATSQTNGGPPNTRYLAEVRSVTDENSPEDEKEIQIARRMFRLLFEGEYRDGYSLLRIAQLIRNETGAPILNPNFIPPLLDLSCSPRLNALLRRQIEILSTRRTALSAPRRQRGKLVAEFSASETANFWLLHTINSYLPELRHIWHVRRGHPEGAYVAMLRLAGALSTFSLEAYPENLPDYNHDQLGACFHLLDEKIRELLETVIPSKFVPIGLELVDRFIWAGKVTEDQYLRNSQFYLAVSAKMGLDDIIRKVPQLVKISAMDDVQRVIRNSLPGLTLRHAPVPPAAIPVKLDNQYFSLNQAGPLWDAIQLSRHLGVYAPGEIVDPKMELIIVLE
jgi:type VI secretion system protein ImpJ